MAVRHVRRDAMEQLKKHAHDSGVTEDQEKQCEKDLQKLTDDYIAKIDAARRPQGKRNHDGVRDWRVCTGERVGDGHLESGSPFRRAWRSRVSHGRDVRRFRDRCAARQSGPAVRLRPSFSCSIRFQPENLPAHPLVFLNQRQIPHARSATSRPAAAATPRLWSACSRGPGQHSSRRVNHAAPRRRKRIYRLISFHAVSSLCESKVKSRNRAGRRVSLYMGVVGPTYQPGVAE